MLQTSLNFEPFVQDAIWREALSDVLRPYSRGFIADRLEALTGQKCSEAIINNWAAPSNNNHRTPAIFVSALCEVTQTTRLLQIIQKPILPLINRTRMEELAKLHEEKRRIENRLSELEGRS